MRNIYRELMASHTKLYCEQVPDCREFGMKQMYCRMCINFILTFQKKKREGENKGKKRGGEKENGPTHSRQNIFPILKMILIWRSATKVSLSQWSKAEWDLFSTFVLPLSTIFLFMPSFRLLKDTWFSFTVFIFFFTVSKWGQDLLYSGVQQPGKVTLTIFLTTVTGADILCFSLHTLLKWLRRQLPPQKHFSINMWSKVPMSDLLLLTEMVKSFMSAFFQDNLMNPIEWQNSFEKRFLAFIIPFFFFFKHICLLLQTLPYI